MNRRKLKLVLAIGVLSLLGGVGVALATGGNNFMERLTGYEETPQSLRCEFAQVDRRPQPQRDRDQGRDDRYENGSDD